MVLFPLINVCPWIHSWKCWERWRKEKPQRVSGLCFLLLKSLPFTVVDILPSYLILQSSHLRHVQDQHHLILHYNCEGGSHRIKREQWRNRVRWRTSSRMATITMTDNNTCWWKYTAIESSWMGQENAKRCSLFRKVRGLLKRFKRMTTWLSNPTLRYILERHEDILVHMLHKHYAQMFIA